MEENTSDSSLLKLGVQSLFVFVVSALLLNWLATKFKKYLSSWMKSEDQIAIPESAEAIQRYSSEKEDIVKKLQKKHDEKAQDYSERIAIPREEEKMRKKIEKCERFSGPAWKGKGHLLGTEESAGINEMMEDADLTPGQSAARRRVVQEDINQRVLASSQQTKAAPVKKEIKLPPEPEEEGPSVMTIVFRTPIGTSCQRRFFINNTVQNALDFITTQGFSQRVYTLATSYPRVTLDNNNLTLADLELGRRVVLNIEDRD